MNRREFFKLSVGGIAIAAAERSFPFRVFSFPQEVIIVQRLPRRIDSLCDFESGRIERQEYILRNDVWVKQKLSYHQTDKIVWAGNDPRPNSELAKLNAMIDDWNSESHIIQVH